MADITSSIQIFQVFELIVLIFSAIVHEVSHGAMADRLGDPTAKYEGRLTLNPVPHFDLWGSFLVPVFLLLSGSWILFGWPKPVPVNPFNLRNQKRDILLVAFAGPASNLLIAVVFGLIIRILMAVNIDTPLVLFFALIVLINLTLAVFNLFPIPPLDGSKILFSLLPYRAMAIQKALEEYYLLLIIVFIFLGGFLIYPIIQFLFTLIVGIPFSLP